MELYQLKTFKMVAEERHLTRAAKRLNASQPAVSAHIKALEGELGVSLFLRTPKGMELTDAGRKLKEHADKALQVVDDMVSHAGLLRGIVSGDFRIGINSEPDSLKIPELFTTMQIRHPDLQIHLLQSMTYEVLNKLEDGELDAGFMYGVNDSEKIHNVMLHRLPLVVAGPLAWQNKLENPTPPELEALPWVLTPADCPFHTVSSELFRQYGIHPARVALSNQESTIKSMVRSGVGLALLLERDTWEKGERVLSVWQAENLVLPLSVACLKRRKDEQIMRTLFSVLLDIWETDDNSIMKKQLSQ